MSVQPGTATSGQVHPQISPTVNPPNINGEPVPSQAQVASIDIP